VSSLLPTGSARRATRARSRALCVAALALALPTTPAAALDPTKSISQLTLQVWQDELPQNTVHSILQTRDGYLWLGTYEGLARFDGVRFVVFDLHRTHDLAGTSALALEEDRDGRLYVATNGGLTVLEGGVFRTLGVADGLPSRLVTAVRATTDGTLWIGTDHGLATLRDGHIQARPDLEAGYVWSLARQTAPNAADVVWAGTNNGLLRVGGRGAEQARRYTLADGLPSASCRSVFVDPQGVWVGTDAGLARLASSLAEPTAPAAFTVYRAADGLGDDYVRAIAGDRDGSLWVGTESAGLARLRDGRFERFGAHEGLSHNYVRSIYEDREGNLWVGTNGGLNRFRQGKFNVYGVPEGLAADFVRSIFEDRDGVIWVGTDGGGVARRAAGVWTALSTADGLSHNSVRSIWQTPDGALWFGTRSGLDRFLDGRITRFGKDAGLPSLLIRALYADRQGDLWVGAEGGGLARLRAGRVAAAYMPADGLAGSDVRAIFEDRRNRLWIGTYSGLSVFANGRFRSFHTSDGLSNDIVFAFHEDADGNLWIGTDSGLSLLRGTTAAVLDLDAASPSAAAPLFTSFGIDDGLFDSKVFRILEDATGTFWLSSNRGLYTVRRADLLARADGRLERVTSVGYGKSEGMRANQVNGTSQPAGWRARDGHLWFPTVKGVVEVDPLHIPVNTLPPPVAIEEVRLNGKPVPLTGAEPLAADFEQLEIHYTGLSFVAPEKVTFRYRLGGNGHDWIDAGGRRTAYYTHLPPGRYELQVTAANNDGLWNEQGASFAFVVATPLTRTWWAFLIYAAAIVATAAGAASLRLRRLARANAQLEARVGERTAALDEKVRQLEESERRAHASEERALEANRAKSVFLSNMSHELRTPLNSIIGFSELMEERLGGELGEKYRRFLGNIRRSGQHLLHLINELLDLSKIEAGRMDVYLESLDPGLAIEEARELIRGVSNARRIEVEVELATTPLPRVTTDAAKLRQILLNLLSNAVKFSPDGAQVTVRAAGVAADRSPLFEESLRIDVVDHGIGIARADHVRIFEEFRQVEDDVSRRQEGTGLGLALVRGLLVILGGAIELESELGRGSTFTVFLPLTVACKPTSPPG
jgi:signal transduction histidine kinase/ligand-binding sensor domain-containing protein